MTEKIKEKLKEKGLKQGELAKELEISKENISQRMKKDNWRINELERIAEILKCDLICEFKEKN